MTVSPVKADGYLSTFLKILKKIGNIVCKGDEMKTILKVILFCLLVATLLTGLAAMKDYYNQRQSEFIEHQDGTLMREAERQALSK